MPTHESHAGSQTSDYPVFDLSYTVDDDESPATVTVFSERPEELSTCWLSIDVEHAVDLADVA